VIAAVSVTVDPGATLVGAATIELVHASGSTARAVAVGRAENPTASDTPTTATRKMFRQVRQGSVRTAGCGTVILRCGRLS
jgi:hypothetical protein